MDRLLRRGQAGRGRLGGAAPLPSSSVPQGHTSRWYHLQGANPRHISEPPSHCERVAGALGPAVTCRSRLLPSPGVAPVGTPC